ncbi:MAG: hypothetical protein RR440_00245 [Erysipelotrichaceae bacterium]
MSITIKIHNTEIERELTDATDIWYYKKQLKIAEENGQVLRAKLTDDGYLYYTIGELNVDKAARLIYEILKKQGKM